MRPSGAYSFPDMRTPLRRPGSGGTLLELLLVLGLIAIVAGVAAPQIAQMLDRIAVRSAAATLGRGIARARVVALSRSGSTVVMDPAGRRYWIETAPGVAGDTVTLLGAPGTVQVIGGSTGPVRIRFSALGLGEVASRSFLFRLGRAEAHLTVSSYGRVRLW